MTDPQSSAALLPCPFCGGVGDIESQPSYSQAANTYDRYRGWCDQCGFGLDWHGHEADAITAWNTRANPAPSDQAGWQEAVKEHLTTEVLDEATKLEVVRWEGRIHCAYLNDFRVAGGKPWAGGTTEKSWGVTLRDVIRAFPALQKALGFNYLGQPLPTAPTLTAGEGGE